MAERDELLNTTVTARSLEPAPLGTRAAADALDDDRLQFVVVGQPDGLQTITTPLALRRAPGHSLRGQRLLKGFEVGNELVSLEPEVTRALSEHGVAGATAIGRGTSITVSGTVGSPDERTAALAAARAVEGVTEIIDDRLNLEVVTALNALPQVGFATGSARISAASRPVLDRAAQLLRTAGAVSIEIRGYTDTRGSTARNLLLSQARAEAARTQLVERGVGEATLTATGLGETEQFGEEPEANRVVRFSQIDG